MALLATNLGAPAVWIAPFVVVGGYVAGDALALYALGALLPVATPILAGMAALSGAAAHRVASEQRLARSLRADAAHGAMHDALTGLPNRAWMHLQLGEAIAAAERLGQSCSLLLVDLDWFKEVNATLGREAGDAALREVTRRLLEALAGRAMVARHGGDEFALLVPGSDAQAAASVAERVLHSLAGAAQFEDREIPIGASIGIVAYPAHGADPETLLRHAELAMYSAKRTRGSFATYSADDARESAERHALIGDLRHALEDDELVLYYQPKVDCHSRRLAGVEALARWRHPALGLVGPDRFIGLAEETGLIAPLTRWALNAALRQARLWLDAGLDIPIAVNLSAADVQEATLPALIGDLLARWDVPARLLSVEITEGALLANSELALDVLLRLKQVGVVAALDDFGSGYSSLGYLKHYPVHELKIDRSLVTDLVREARDRTIVRSTVELGHSLGLVVVAEGVEDEATLAMLDSLGCDLAQGYLVAQPMPAARLTQWASERAGLAA
jgi:diguanylate cyclase